MRIDIPGVALSTIGRLGGATKQAVSASRDPLRWIRYRTRMALGDIPDPNILRDAAKRELIRLRGLDAILPPPNPSSRGARPKRDVGALAAFLGVEPDPKGDVLGVFARFLARCISALLAVLPRLERLTAAKRAWAILEALGDWLPDHPKDPAWLPIAAPAAVDYLAGIVLEKSPAPKMVVPVVPTIAPIPSRALAAVPTVIDYLALPREEPALDDLGLPAFQPAQADPDPFEAVMESLPALARGLRPVPRPALAPVRPTVFLVPDDEIETTFFDEA